MSSPTFNLVVYQPNPRGGFDQVTFVLDERLTIVKEVRETVATYSVRDAARAFSKALVESGPVLRQGVDAEIKAANVVLAEQVMLREKESLVRRHKVSIPDASAKKGLAILTGESPPCDGNPECLKIRADFKAAIAAAEALAEKQNRTCKSCELGPIVVEYQLKLLEAGFTKVEEPVA